MNLVLRLGESKLRWGPRLVANGLAPKVSGQIKTGFKAITSPNHVLGLDPRIFNKASRSRYSKAMKFSVEIQATQHRIKPRGPPRPARDFGKDLVSQRLLFLERAVLLTPRIRKPIFFLISDSDWRAARSVIRFCGKSSVGFDTVVYPCCICTPARRRGPGVAAAGQDHTPLGMTFASGPQQG